MYLESTFPVTCDGRVVIPAGVYVKGVLDHVVRPGRVKGKAEVNMHFTTIIFPSGTTVEIPGQINSLPGSTGPSVTGDEGTVQPSGSKGKDAADIAKAAPPEPDWVELPGFPPTTLQSPSVTAHWGEPSAGTLYTLFTRGEDVSIPQGTPIEMVLRRPLVLEEQQVAVAAGRLSPPWHPVQDQPAPMQKPPAK